VWQRIGPFLIATVRKMSRRSSTKSPWAREGPPSVIGRRARAGEPPPSYRIISLKRVHPRAGGGAGIWRFNSDDVTGPSVGMLARGIGRHRAFGFGMLLLRTA
jgi:hypothetical protein